MIEHIQMDQVFDPNIQLVSPQILDDSLPKVSKKVNETGSGKKIKNQESVRRRNERERNRIKKVNQAFDDLRNFLPMHPNDKRRSSKVDTLKWAIVYIKELQSELKEETSPEGTKVVKKSEDQSRSSPTDPILDDLSDSNLYLDFLQKAKHKEGLEVACESPEAAEALEMTSSTALPVLDADTLSLLQPTPVSNHFTQIMNNIISSNSPIEVTFVTDVLPS